MKLKAVDFNLVKDLDCDKDLQGGLKPVVYPLYSAVPHL